jgi:hypothetical protein
LSKLPLNTAASGDFNKFITLTPRLVQDPEEAEPVLSRVKNVEALVGLSIELKTGKMAEIMTF